MAQSVLGSAWERREPWTFDDLTDLPGEGWRYEIVEGVLQVSPAPGKRHEVVLASLRYLLQDQLGPGLIVIGPVNLDLGPSHHREPDAVVVDRSGPDLVHFPPGDIRLAIEVVSPSSRTTDRVVKPAEYAAAGIAAYWRVEIEDGISITAYALPPGETVYAEVGTWAEGEVMELDAPFAVRVAVADLVP